MDRERYETGLKVRAEVLGEEYVDKAVRGATDFNREFQNLVTEYCWGEVWGSPHLDRKQRSILNLGMLAALGRSHEFELHFRGAIRNWPHPRRVEGRAAPDCDLLRNSRRGGELQDRPAGARRNGRGRGPTSGMTARAGLSISEAAPRTDEACGAFPGSAGILPA